MTQFQCDVTMLTTADDGIRPGHPLHVVVHTNQGPADAPVEGLLRFMQNRANGASYHVVVNAAGVTGRSNDDEYIPWAAGYTSNRLGMHLCLMGYAEDTTAQWLARGAQLDAAADVAADWCRRYGIPAVKLTGAEMRRRARGFGGHDTTVDAWHETDHWDPGKGFPWAEFIARVNTRLNGEPDMADQRIDQILQLVRETRAIAEDCQVQLRGPNLKGWPQLGQNDRGENLTLVDGVAALRADSAEGEGA